MAHGSRLVDLVQHRIEDFLADRSLILRSISPDLVPLDAFSKRFLSGGKRFRARFCYWGFEAVAGRGSPEPSDLFPIVSAASALELFHAAALVHDDLIDHSDTRRGAPSAHRLFERLHRDSDWAGDAAGYGSAAAILLGDLLLGWSDELLDEGLEAQPDRARARAARAEFIRMRTEVTAGQYLDILEEQAWRTRGDHEQRAHAERVIVFKSAKYSVESPLAIGAALAGATTHQLQSLRDFGLPLGIAYQLRDDLLGVYGDPEVTGKPAGDDLREGKRTMLVAIARERLGAGQRNLLDELLGDPDLDPDQVSMLQRTIEGCGAVDEVEALIGAWVAKAGDVLADAPIDAGAKAELGALARDVARRAS
ncbi:polyprenyl synthetase family protein [Agromyces aerolatus]|uniref:polyprenyl synthetase family protein n=1 Tax=Agromyces sp. LY-1074 TaxID=3074080 RepID=UPI002861F237|nr:MULTISPECIES: polyprenyl synthetase family protein [unclassified Agromyces]MDR5700779.1 polyprenyl synthetase family protein [Agromyces sp. LY-1074]MDR5707300.1 polyprenyl synthetase family protein [Agromyces sp. LY-1358]